MSSKESIDGSDVKISLNKDEELEKWKKFPLEVFVSTRILQVVNIDDGKGKLSCLDSDSIRKMAKYTHTHTHKVRSTFNSY